VESFIGGHGSTLCSVSSAPRLFSLNCGLINQILCSVGLIFHPICEKLGFIGLYFGGIGQPLSPSGLIASGNREIMSVSTSRVNFCPLETTDHNQNKCENNYA
jgi:hypothetical protein